jgi:hypothetical protein
MLSALHVRLAAAAAGTAALMHGAWCHSNVGQLAALGSGRRSV